MEPGPGVRLPDAPRLGGCVWLRSASGAKCPISRHRNERVQGVHMRPAIIGSFLVCATKVAAPATGQTPTGAPAIARTVVASTKLPTVVDTPLHFKAVSVTIPSGASSRVSPTNGIVYQLSGSTEVSIGGEVKTLAPGEGL